MDGAALEFQLHNREVLMFSLGMYLWEFLVSLGFELDLCLRRLPFKWPLVPYFLARYAALIYLISTVILDVGTKPLDCRALFEISLIFGNSAVAASSCNLMIRAIIIWAYQWYIVVPLCLIALGQWVLFGVGFKSCYSSWNQEARACIDNDLDLRYVGAFGVYTAGFDLIILIVSLGIVYCALVLAAQSIMAICAFAVSDAQYSSFSGLIAVPLCPAVSCRMVRSILKTDLKGWRPTTTPAETMDGLELSTRINLGTLTTLSFDHMKHEEGIDHDQRSIP